MPPKYLKVNTVVVPAVFADRQRRTCLAIESNGHSVKYIPLSVEFGLCVEETPASEFIQLYELLDDYPAERCAALFASYAVNIGASDAVLEHLGRLIKLPIKEIQMATAKKAAAKSAVVKPSAAKAPAAGKKTVTAKEPKADKPSAPRESAASMFKELILAGNLTDEKIFKKVQEKFGLDDNKSGYVKWYRNDLSKKGLNPPDAK